MSKRVYSYDNHMIALCHSPFILDVDRDALKKYDGKEVIRELPERGQVLVNTPWGLNIISILFSRLEDEMSLTFDSFKTNLKAQKDYRIQVNMDISMDMHVNFVTLSYILSSEYSGFAMVSCHGIKNGLPQFFPNSDLFVLPDSMNESMATELQSKYFGWFPSGKIENSETLKVYITSVDRIEKCLTELTGNNKKLRHLDMKPIADYCLCHNEVSEKCKRLQNNYLSQCMALLNSTSFEHIQFPHTNQYKQVSLNTNTQPLINSDCDLARPVEKAKEINTILVSKGTKYQKVQELKNKGYSIGQVSQRLGLSYKTVSQLWKELNE